MGYGGPRLRQHVIEFIPGTGMVTDGAIDATTTTGPWTWVVPDNYLGDLLIDCLAGGAGGAGGGLNSADISCGGGGGGGAFGIYGYSLMSVLPNESVTVTAGAAGTGGAVGSAGTNGGTSSVVAPGASASNGCSTRACVANMGAVLEVLAVAGSSSASGSGAGGAGQGSTNNGFTIPGAGTNSGMYTNLTSFGSFIVATGAGGGSGASSGTSVGGNGAQFSANFSANASSMAVGGISLNQSIKGTGNDSGGVSYGGGGAGGNLPNFPGGDGGAGNAAGQNCPNLGGGGGGGGGNAAGGNGGAGYVRLTYYAVD